MITTQLRVLLVEDSEDDAELACLALTEGGFRVTARRVETEADFLKALEEPWDVIISDFQMPTFDGLRAFALYAARGLDTPFIFVSGALGEERAVAAMRAGARDYLLKENLARLPVAVRRELDACRERRRLRAADAAARQEQRRLRAAVEASGAGIFELGGLDGEEPAVYLSDRFLALVGVTDEAIDGVNPLDVIARYVHDEDRQRYGQAVERFLAGRSENLEIEVRLLRADGQTASISVRARAEARTKDGALRQAVGVVMDLTERRALEAQFLQAQKMEAVGQLAGGVAHDFNNLLTVIVSFTTFAKDAVDNEAVRADLEDVLGAARKAESLTAQLLAFSRRQVIAPRIIDLNATVAGVQRMLGRLIGEDIELVVNLDAGLGRVLMDPRSMDQVLVNLAVNARDAMPAGGRLGLETANEVVEAGAPPRAGVSVAPGAYVRVSVSDSGTGIPPDVVQHIFEPFFTTKEQGKGTGLGLSTCYGIVKQAGGYIFVDTGPGEGTRFDILLPRAYSDAEVVSERPAPTTLEGRETILVAEDDDQVRGLIVRALTPFGYTVLAAAEGREAIELFRKDPDRIALLLTDVVMPGMSGRALADALRGLAPGLRVMFMSGYTAKALEAHGLPDDMNRILRKPFTPDSLVLNVRQALDEELGG